MLIPVNNYNKQLRIQPNLGKKAIEKSNGKKQSKKSKRKKKQMK